MSRGTGERKSSERGAPTDRRSYADPCGVARALDAVGERWALLVVRELSLGPRRFGQLRTSLPGLSPNVLAQRLRDLEDVGVLRRYRLEPPADTIVYELTDRGYSLDPVLQALGRWGSAQPPISGREVSTVSFLRSLRVLVAPGVPDVEYGLKVDGEHFGFAITDGLAQVTRGRPSDPLATLSGDVATLRSVILVGEDVRPLESDGSLTIAGDRRAALRLPRLFRH